MSRRLTETFDPEDFLQFAQQGNALMQDDIILDFESAMVNGITTYPIAILSDLPAEVFGGVFHYYSGGPLTTKNIITFSSDDVLQGYVRVNAANAKLELLIDGAVVAIGTVNYALNTRHHLQWRYKVNNSTGVFEIKLDEDLDVLTFTGDTLAAGAGLWVNRFEFQATGDRYDSLYINDTVDTGEGSTGYDGVRRFISAVPPADGFWQDWDLSSGSDGFAMVNQTPHDGDATIVSSVVNGQKVSFTVAPHGLTAPSEIKAVMARWVVRKVSNGAIRPFFRINGTDYPIVDASVPIGVDYTCVVDRRVINPNTGVAWTLGDTIESVGLESVL